MVFSSIPFLFFFFPLFILIYFICSRLSGSIRLKNLCLLAFSLIFYAWGEPVCVLVMICTAFNDYFWVALCDRRRRAEGETKAGKIYGFTAVAIDLLILIWFKYAGFLASSFNSVTGAGIPVPDVALPIGISFFTFQSMSYTIDHMRGQVEKCGSFTDYLTYVSCFPQLIAGPVVRYKTVSEELRERTVTGRDLQGGFQRFLMGLAKKVLIANRLGVLWDMSLAAVGGWQGSSVAGAWLGACAFALQLYFDFSAYSDMAIGMGRMMGFNFPENFNYPLFSCSLTEFWRRWHISLSGWFRDYVYIPLGGNRCGAARRIFNLFVVWSLTGMWHGASWNFLIWGLYNLFILLLEKYVLSGILEKLPSAVRSIYTFSVVIIGFVIFAIDDPGELIGYMSVMFGVSGGRIFDGNVLWHLRSFGAVLAVAVILANPVFPYLRERFGGEDRECIFETILAVTLAAAFVASVSFLVSDAYNPFLYFRF